MAMSLNKISRSSVPSLRCQAVRRSSFGFLVVLLVMLGSMEKWNRRFAKSILDQQEIKGNKTLSSSSTVAKTSTIDSIEQERKEFLNQVESWKPTSTMQPPDLQPSNVPQPETTRDATAAKEEEEDGSTTTTTTTTSSEEVRPSLPKTNAITDPKLLEKNVWATNMSSHYQEDFPWFADLDFSTGYAEACGMNKCFYASRTNPQMGYLIARSSQYKQMRKAHKLEVTIAQEFGCPQLSQSLEVIDHIPKSIIRVIRDFSLQWGYKQPQPIIDDRKHNAIVLQKTLRVPSPSLTTAFTPRKGGSMLKRMPEFKPKIVDPIAFNATFMEERARLLRTIRAYPSLLDDFQFIVDAHGKIYHIDLDRNGYDEEWTEEEIDEDVSLRARDLMWLLEHLTPSLERSHHQKCLHSFCKKVIDPWR